MREKLKKGDIVRIEVVMISKDGKTIQTPLAKIILDAPTPDGIWLIDDMRDGSLRIPVDLSGWLAENKEFDKNNYLKGMGFSTINGLLPRPTGYICPVYNFVSRPVPAKQKTEKGWI